MIFACVFVRGYVGYSPTYVSRLASMVRRHYDGDCRVICLTDQPGAVRRFVDEVREVETPPNSHPWWAKLELFRPGQFAAGVRVCYLDLDVLVWRSLNVISDYPTRLALVPHAGNFEGKGLRRVVKRYNSSVMVWEAGSEIEALHRNFTPDVMHRLWGDQDWIGEQMPHARTMPLAWFPRLSEFDAAGGAVPLDARVVLCKRPKNEQAAADWPWFREAWR